jgi:hypothetical protein
MEEWGCDSVRIFSRPRASRDITVPIGMFRAWAAS